MYVYGNGRWPIDAPCKNLGQIINTVSFGRVRIQLKHILCINEMRRRARWKTCPTRFARCTRISMRIVHVLCASHLNTKFTSPKWKTTNKFKKRRQKWTPTKQKKKNEQKTKNKIIDVVKKRGSNNNAAAEQHLQRKLQIVRRLCGLIRKLNRCMFGGKPHLKCIYCVRVSFPLFSKNYLFESAKSQRGKFFVFGCTCSSHSSSS